MTTEDKIFERLNENSERITRVETKLEQMIVDGQRSRHVIGKQLEELNELLVGVRYMAKSFKWMAGGLFAIGLWLIHEWETLKRLFKA